MNSLREFGLLCLGVYRLLEPESKDPKRQKRYVITNPPKWFKLLTSDRVRSHSIPEAQSKVYRAK